jgi:beta-lactam-binding protein with PASTA domain
VHRAHLKGKLLAGLGAPSSTRVLRRLGHGCHSRSVTKGRVISQRPSASSHRIVGVKVNLVVSKGKAKSR